MGDVSWLTYPTPYTLYYYLPELVMLEVGRRRFVIHIRPYKQFKIESISAGCRLQRYVLYVQCTLYIVQCTSILFAVYSIIFGVLHSNEPEWNAAMIEPTSDINDQLKFEWQHAMLNMAIYPPFTLESNGSVKSIGCTQIKLYHFTDFYGIWPI